jgi:hypothetical protein
LIRDGQLDAVDLSPVLNLPPDKRIDGLPQLLTGVRAELAAQRYQGAPKATDLDERIESFARESIGRDLRQLPTGLN